jgi:hypothetical protein
MLSNKKYVWENIDDKNGNFLTKIPAEINPTEADP